jgi:hypothetical protein
MGNNDWLFYTYGAFRLDRKRAPGHYESVLPKAYFIRRSAVCIPNNKLRTDYGGE